MARSIALVVAALGLLASVSACGGSQPSSAGADKPVSASATASTTVNITNVVAASGGGSGAAPVTAAVSPDGALSAALAYAVQLTTYDYVGLDRELAALLQNATDSFRTEYTKATQSLRESIQRNQANASGKVLDAGVESFDGTHATILMFVDQTVTNASSKTPRVDRTRMRMSLVQQDGRWLISSLDLI